MATLYLGNVPDRLYQDLQSVAKDERTGVEEITLQLLHDAVARKQRGENGASPVDLSPSAIRELLAQIVRNRYAPAQGTPDSAELLREDRDR
jgi:hypothetical protein